MQKIKVDHYNTYLRGGAAIAARRIFNSLQKFDDLELRHLSLNISDEKNYFTYKNFKERSKIQRQLNKIPLLESKQHNILREFPKYMLDRPEGLEIFSLLFREKKTLPQEPLPQILHFHWIAEWLDFPSFFKHLPKDIPLVWTLHDMHPITGGCHYSNDCNKFENDCSNCPQLGPYNKFDISAYNLSLKIDALKDRDIYIAADSHWLKDQARKSQVFKNAKSIECVHYGMNDQVYSPVNKEACRKELGLELENDEFVICFGADYIDTKRKGISELIQAIKILNEKNIKITCVVFGSGEYETLENIKYVNFGEINDENFLAKVYNLADVFVIPSLEEAFGQTCLEAMMCGVPVIGFNTGGIADMIKDYETGLMAKKGDVNDLADKIYKMLTDRSLKNMLATNARKYAVENFQQQTQANKYHSLYKSII